MESRTYIKDIKISPKKLRFLLPEIKKYRPVAALDFLYYTPKKSAKIFFEIIKSAINNAKEFLKVDEKRLRFKFLTVEEGKKLKRFRPGGRGTAKPITRRFSHIKIILEAEAPAIATEIKQKELKVKANKSKIRSSNVPKAEQVRLRTGKSNPKSIGI